MNVVTFVQIRTTVKLWENELVPTRAQGIQWPADWLLPDN